MHRSPLLLALFVLVACAETPPAAPPRRMPPGVIASPQPIASVPAKSRDEAQPAADPAVESARIAQPVDGVAVATSRTGRHRLRMIAVLQRVTPVGVTLEFGAALEPSSFDVVMGRVLPVRRFVTTDGWEIASPEQHWSVDAVHGNVSSQGIDLGGRTHRGLRNLDLDARIYEIRERETFTRGPFGPGERVAHFGPFPVKVIVEEHVVTVAAWTDPDAERAWNARHAQPLIEALDFEWVLGAVEVRDARGRALTLTGASGSGGHAVGQFVADAASFGAPVEAPLSVSLAVPATYVREDTSFYFQDLPLSTVEGR